MQFYARRWMRRGVGAASALLVIACGGGGNGPPTISFGDGHTAAISGDPVGSSADGTGDAEPGAAPVGTGDSNTSVNPSTPGNPSSADGAGDATAGTGPVGTQGGAEAEPGDSPRDTVVFDINYESGTLDSGITGVGATHASAPDAARIVDNVARNGRYAISHKVTLDDPAYVSDGKPRSESDLSAAAVSATRYRPGMHAIYTVSVLLKDWQDWKSGDAHPVDIVWQFKHTNGGPDAFVGVRRNQLIFRYEGTGGGQKVLINDIRPFDNKWIDLKFDIQWSDTDNGWFKAWVRAPDQNDFSEAVDIPRYRTFTDNATGDFGYLKWGLYRPDSNSTDAGVALTREIYHDSIKISTRPFDGS